MEKTITTSIRLQNGLTGIITCMKNLPKPIKGQFWGSVLVRTGSLDDGSDPGIAHFTEHMLLALDKLPPTYENDFKFQLVGNTSFDRTQYILRCRSDNGIKGLNILKNILYGKYLCPFLLNDIRNDILKEYQAKLSSSEVAMIKKILNNTSLSGYSPIGNVECIKSIDFAHILTFFNNNYLLLNECICILTDLNYDIVVSYLSSVFHSSIIKSTNILPSAGIALQEYIPTLKPNYLLFNRLSFHNILNLPNNEMHIYIKSLADKHSVAKLTLESIILTIGEECIRYSFKSVKNVECSVNKFTEDFRFMHFIIKFDNSESVRNISKNNIASFLINWILMCENNFLIKRVKKEYRNYIKVPKYHSIDFLEMLQSLEDSFFYKHRCFFYTHEMLDTINKIESKHISTFLKRSLYEYNVYIFTKEIGKLGDEPVPF